MLEIRHQHRSSRLTLQPDNSSLSLPSPPAPRSPLPSDSCLSEQLAGGRQALLHNKRDLRQAQPFVVPKDGGGRTLPGAFSSYRHGAYGNLCGVNAMYDTMTAFTCESSFCHGCDRAAKSQAKTGKTASTRAGGATVSGTSICPLLCPGLPAHSRVPRAAAVRSPTSRLTGVKEFKSFPQRLSLRNIEREAS